LYSRREKNNPRVIGTFEVGTFEVGTFEVGTPTTGYNPHPIMKDIRTEWIAVDRLAPEPDRIRRAADCILNGGLVAFPTETVYGLGANAQDPAAVRRIYSAKGRPFHDPLIVHLASMDGLDSVATDIPTVVRELGGRFWPGPLTLILPRNPYLPAEVSAGLETVAVRVPSHPVARALLAASGVPIAAPSANRFGHTSPTLARHVREDLDGRIDLILDGGPTDWGVESTILDPLSDPPVLLRPGGVTLPELEAIFGTVRIARPRELVDASPGRQPRHYAPNVLLILCPGDDPEQIAASVSETAQRLAAENKRIGILAATEVFTRLKPPDVPLLCTDLGPFADARRISRRLFSGLRELEKAGVDVILAHRVPPEGLGAAINDRLTRAAEIGPSK
jgi:L-threonylcarbamoyladenylate synthase